MGIDAKIKAKWVEALRSGEYKQTCGVLERRGRNCCLGVLVRVQGFKIVNEYNVLGLEGSKCGPYIPKEINGGLLEDDERFLAHMNDINKANFKQIADYIEKNL